MRLPWGTLPNGLQLAVDGTTLSGFAPDIAGLSGVALPPAFGASLRGSHVVSVVAPGDLAPSTPTAGDASALDADKLLDLLVYVEYSIG